MPGSLRRKSLSLVICLDKSTGAEAGEQFRYSSDVMRELFVSWIRL